MKNKYSDLVSTLIKLVGGRDNIEGVRHCVTRLRFHLKDDKKADDKAIKNTEGVITSIKAAGEYMIVIGDHVGDVYDETCHQLGVEPNGGAYVEVSKAKTHILKSVMNVIMGAIGPALDLLCATGIIKGLLTLLLMAGVSADSGIYVLLNAASDAFFIFLPMILGYNTAKNLKIDPVYGFVLGAALCYPAIQGKDISLFGYVANATYTSTFLPVVVGVAISAPFYKLLKKHIPASFAFAIPLFTLVIMFPLSFMILGPVSNMAGAAVSSFINWLFTLSPIIAGTALGGLHQVFVLFGIHGVIGMQAFIDVMQGIPSYTMAVAMVPSFAQTAICLAIYLKTKKKDLKGVTLPAVISAFFGVTEPSIYGVTLPRVKMFVLSCISAAFGGLLIGIFKLPLYTYTGIGIMSLLGFINPENPQFLQIAISFIIPTVIAFILGMVFYSDNDSVSGEAEAKPVVKTEPVIETKTAAINKEVKKETIGAPVAGTAKALNESSDEAFASEALGKGALVIPCEDEIYAPADGTVSVVFPTGHAYGITTDNGCELLIHIGVNTVDLNGKHFTPNVKQGDKVKKGDLLAKINREGIQKAGYSTETLVIITNTNDYNDIKLAGNDSIKAGDDLLVLKSGGVQ